MDGLLIDSEPSWRDAIVQVFGSVGIPMTLEKCRITMGMTTPQLVEYWCDQFPSHGSTLSEIVQLVDATAHRFIAERAPARPGVYEVLEFFKQKQIPLALASSSTMHLINIVVDKLKIRSYFQTLYSAEFEEYGKPHPGVNITTAHHLGIEPMNCLVFEDSWNGLLAAKAGAMKCVCVPDEGLRGNSKLAIADAVINSLEDFDEALWNKLI